MIEDLTEEKLKAYGFDENQIPRFFDPKEDKYCAFIVKDKGIFWASNKEKKIYSGLDGSRKYYFISETEIHFPQWDINLIPEYYQKALLLFIKRQKKIAGILFNDKQAETKFIKEEIERAENSITKLKRGEGEILLDIEKLEIQKYEWYVSWLNNTEQRATIPPQANDTLNFSVYLNEKGKPLLSKLKELYSDEKPMIICCMLLALSNLACLTSNLDTANKTQLHRALEQSFGKIGTRQSLSDNLNKLRTDYYKTKVDTCKKKIATLIKKS